MLELKDQTRHLQYYSLELAALPWDHLDLADNIWHITVGHRQKTKRPVQFCGYLSLPNDWLFVRRFVSDQLNARVRVLQSNDSTTTTKYAR